MNLSRPARPFLTTCWRNLVMVNYEVDPRVLAPYVPRGTELDYFDGTCLVSLVGFLFEESKLFGCLASPLHASFEEVNLRFYIVRQTGNEVRRGVTFIRELAPSRCVTWLARGLFQENYLRLPMRRRMDWHEPARPDLGGTFGYEWKQGGRWWELWAETSGTLSAPAEGSLEEFIVEHYWGYSRQRDESTLEYRVEHRPWEVWSTARCRFAADVEAIYGREFVEPLSRQPHSSLVADGSAVAVYRGTRLDDRAARMPRDVSQPAAVLAE